MGFNGHDVKIILRNDDLCAFSNSTKERNLLEAFEKHNIPQVVGVIPFATEDPHDCRKNRFHPLEENQSVTALVEEYHSKGLIEIAQHGVDHQTNEHHPSLATKMTRSNFYQGIDRKWLPYAPKDPDRGYSEFNRLSKSDIKTKILKGKEYLENLFNTKINIFIFPWDSFDDVCLEAVRECGFKHVLCGSRLYTIDNLTLMGDVREVNDDILSLEKFLEDLKPSRKPMVGLVAYHSWMLMQKEIINIDKIFDQLKQKLNVEFISVRDFDTRKPLEKYMMRLDHFTNRLVAKANHNHYRNGHIRMQSYYQLKPFYYFKKIIHAGGVLVLSIPKKCWRIMRKNITKLKMVMNSQAQNESQEDFSTICALAYRHHMKKNIVHKYFAAYEQLKDVSRDDEFKYYQLKYYHSQCRWEPLNKLADLLIKEKKYSVAYMCLIHSLKLNCQQPAIYKLANRIKERGKLVPNRPSTLKADVYAVSVIMVTYNRPEKILQASIESVLDQNFNDFELIIVNNGGSKSIKNYVDSFKSQKIKYIRLPNPKTIAGARNEGVLSAQGKYIAYLDDDDIFYPNHFEIMVNALRSTKKEFFYASTLCLLGVVKDDTFKRSKRDFVWDKKFNKSKLAWKLYFSVSSVMHKKDIYMDVGLFNEELELTEDWEFWLRCAAHHDFGHVSKITSEYRVADKGSFSMRNRVSAFFFGELVTSFYALFQGDVAFVKYHLAEDNIERARMIYERIVEHYFECFKTPLLIKELIRLTVRLQGRRKFLLRLMMDYVYLYPLDCIKTIFDIKTIKKICS